MKKILAILLALMLVLVNVAALADGDTEGGTPEGTTEGGIPESGSTGKTIDVSKLLEPTEEQTLVIKKNYTVTAPEGAELPPDTLTFDRVTAKVEDGAYTNETMPLVSMEAVAVTGVNTTSYDVSIKIPAYEKVGVFYYEFEESDNGVAGVTYIKNKITLRLTVVQDEVNNKLVIAAIAIRENGESGATTTDGKVSYDLSKKVDSLENTYEAGSLSLEKEVTGNMGEYDKVWNFTINLTAPDDTKVFSKITSKTNDGASADAKITKIDDEAATGTVVAAGDGWTTKKIEVSLRHGDKITFENIPVDVTYTIEETEADQDGYTTTPSGKSGTIATGDPIAAKFTNDKKVDIDTGVALDSGVYMLIMALTLVGVAVLVLRRREEY